MATSAFPDFLNPSSSSNFPSYGGQNKTPVAPITNTYGSPNTFSAAVNTNVSDYDSIMKSYDSLLKNSGSQSIPFTPVSPQISPYSRSNEFNSAFSNLSGLSANGGITDADRSNIRARGISPIRSIYANAQRNLDRTKSLQGGYSPNYTASTVKMARELSEELASKSTDIEAGIADMVAKNRLAAAGPMAALAGGENDTSNLIAQKNAAMINDINMANARLASDTNISNRNNALTEYISALQGKQQLYGTNPALTNTFGNQVAQQMQQTQQNKQNNPILNGVISNWGSLR